MLLSTNEGWGAFEPKRAGRSETDTLELKHGQASLRRIRLRLAQGAARPQIKVTLGRKSSGAAVSMSGRTALVRLSQPAVMKAGDRLTVRVAWSRKGTGQPLQA
jgi:hypothetical protein